MTALNIIGGILVFFLLVSLLRVGVVVTYAQTLRVRLRIGVLQLTVWPRARKQAAQSAQTEDAKPQAKPKTKRRALPKPGLDELLTLIDTAFNALGATLRRACKRVCVDPLELTVVFGGGDPARLAMLYGMANTLMFSLMPRAEETFHIPDPSLHLRLDFERENSEATGTLGLSARICDLLAIALTLIVPMGKWYLRFRRTHRHAQAASAQAAQIPEQQPA
ncbi:MAG: DUF2953 domain-containing protein [Oscillospiraceae bacterium]|nr:DUF2953 domain-containing protein [Oscillospiraceae bacterium]